MKIGNYRVIEKLAVGGMAELFLATRADDDSGQVVVIKRLLPHLATEDDFAHMFTDEARLAMRLHHPCIVDTFDLVRSNHELFIVMEYIDGIDVSELMTQCARRGVRLSAGVGVYIACRVLEALDFAHRLSDEQGGALDLVHRDVSPSNVLLSRAGGVRLVDFGIAWSAQRIHKTKTGMLKGKYHYMSPEQALESTVDARSDLFSVGVVLAELLMGRRLFVAKREFDVLLKVRVGDITRLDRYGRHIDPELGAVLRKALSVAPEARFATAAEFLGALEGWRSRHAVGIDATEMATVVGKYYQACRARKKQQMARGPKLLQHAHPNLLQRGHATTQTAAPRPRAKQTVRVDEAVIARLVAGSMERAESPPAGLIAGGGGSARAGQVSAHRGLSADVAAAEPGPLASWSAGSRPGGSRSTILLWQLEEPLAASSSVGIPVATAMTVATPRGDEEAARAAQARDRLPTLDESSLEPADATPRALRPVTRETADDVAGDVVSDVVGDTASDPAGDAASLPAAASLLGLMSEDDDTLDLKTDMPHATGEFSAACSPITLVHGLVASGSSGRLTVSQSEIRKDIYFESGIPRYVSSNLHAELLGQYLVREGVLSAGELSMALAVLPSYDGRLGEALIDLSLLTREAFFVHLTAQVRHKLVDVCTWQTGRYEWCPDESPPAEALAITLDCFEILGAAALALPESVLRDWRARVADQQASVIAASTVGSDRFGLDTAIAVVRDNLGRGRFVDDLWARLAALEAAGKASEARCARALYLMVQTRMVALSDEEF